MKPLYQIVDSLRSIFDRLEESGGEMTPEIASDLSRVEVDFKNKVEAVALWIKAAEGAAGQIGAEIERLSQRKQSVEREIGSLKSYLLEQLIRANETRIKTSLVTVWRQSGQPAVNILNPAEVPARYKSGRLLLPLESIPSVLRDRAEIVIDKKALGDDLKKAPISGAEFLPGREFLRIK